MEKVTAKAIRLHIDEWAMLDRLAIETGVNRHRLMTTAIRSVYFSKNKNSDAA